MKNFNTEKKPIESIEKIILDLIDFSNCNKFDFNLYKSFADEKSKSFNRYFFKIKDQAVKEKIISDLESNFHYFVNGIVFKMQSTRSKNGSVSDETTCIAPLIPDNRISGFENNYNHLIELFLNGIDTENIKNTSNSFQETDSPLDKIRNNNYSNLELITILKGLSNNYENDLLKALLKDIDLYLFVEKEEMECEFSSLEIENAVQKLIENNIEIPYYKKTPFEKLTDKGKKFATRLKENGFTDTPTLNKEQLLFPYEFFEIYRFKNLINSKLNELTPTEPVPENEQNKVYFKVGLLFAKKEIYKNVLTIDGYKKVNYYFKDEVFDNPNQLSKRLSLSRQYINDSFTGAKTKHNIFNNLKQLNNIIEYCNKNEIIIDVEFLNKYSVLLENRH